MDLVENHEEYRDRRRRISLKSYHKNKHKRSSKYKARKAAGVCVSCGVGQPVEGLLRCQPCRERAAGWHRAVISAVMAHYGTECVCCGESNQLFLTLDHAKGGGSKDRATNGGRNYKYYIYKRAQETGEWPTGLQVMCFNCNCGRNLNGGVCPHRAAQTEN